MIQRDDILSMEFLKKTEFTGSHQGMRYRLEGVSREEGKRLLATVWPEPYNYVTTPEEKKHRAEFSFDEDDRLFADREQWQDSCRRWD